MKFEKGQLQLILSCSAATEAKWLDPINNACAKFGIDTKLRLAAFIAQVGHESGGLSTLTENLNYSASGLTSTWPSRFDTFTANSVARNPEKIANIVYASRMGNGPAASGDGWKYRGRGLIQCTGKSNYDAFSQACGVNAVANPDMLVTPDYAAMSAAWFWSSKGLNTYADRGDILTTTKRINGGTIGEADRELLYKRALIVLDGGTPPNDATLAKKPLSVTPDSSSSVTDQKTPAAQNSSIIEPRSASGSGSTSLYPWNLVFESRSGHVSEFDDTPGNERVNVTHRTGTYWEIDKIGTLTHKSVLDSYKLTKGDSYDYTGGNYTQQIKGQSYRQSSGDMIFKSDGQIFMSSSKVQVNTGTFAVSGEIDAPTVNANIFGGISGLAFGDMLAKEAMVAYDIKKGSAPMLNQSLGFKGTDDSPGSADSLMPNTLSQKAPDGTPWVTNGVPTAAALVTAGALAVGMANLLKGNDPDQKVSNAINSAASASSDDSQTPVFLKHASFAKPTLFSLSTVADKPDPSLYVNNIHTIVGADGVGVLSISDGQNWNPIGTQGVANSYTDGKISDVMAVITDNQGKTASQIAQEAQDRADAITAEAQARLSAIQDEAQARQDAITQGLLSEAQARGAAIDAESTARQDADSSLSDHITTLTAAVGDNASAIQQEQQARADAISAEATARQDLAATVAGHTASISDEITARTNGDNTITDRLTQYISSNDTALATAKSDLTTQINGVDDALSSRIDTLSTANDNNSTLINNETTARVNAISALTDSTNTQLSQTNTNLTALINTESQTRTDADSSLSSRIDTLSGKVDNNAALISTEQQARADGDSANATQIGVVSAAANAKSTVFRQSTQPTAKAVNDVWIDTGNQNRMKVWDGSNWVDMTDTRITQNSADIVTEQTARANGDSANAQSISTLQTTVNGHTTSISTNTTSINGIKAQWGVKVNNNGQVSGVALVSDLIAGNPVSNFTIVSDVFQLVKPSLNNGNPVMPFSIDTTTSPPTINLDGLVRIKSGNITLASVDTPSLRVGAVSDSAIATSISSNIVSGSSGQTGFSGAVVNGPTIVLNSNSMLLGGVSGYLIYYLNTTTPVVMEVGIAIRAHNINSGQDTSFPGSTDGTYPCYDYPTSSVPLSTPLANTSIINLTAGTYRLDLIISATLRDSGSGNQLGAGYGGMTNATFNGSLFLHSLKV